MSGAARRPDRPTWRFSSGRPRTVFGWSLSKVLGFCLCGVLVPGLLIWRLETGDNPDRTLGFF